MVEHLPCTRICSEQCNYIIWHFPAAPWRRNLLLCKCKTRGLKPAKVIHPLAAGDWTESEICEMPRDCQATVPCLSIICCSICPLQLTQTTDTFLISLKARWPHIGLPDHAHNFATASTQVLRLMRLNSWNKTYIYFIKPHVFKLYTFLPWSPPLIDIYIQVFISKLAFLRGPDGKCHLLVNFLKSREYFDIFQLIDAGRSGFGDFMF